jgi:hypothetical protein
LNERTPKPVAYEIFTAPVTSVNERKKTAHDDLVTEVSLQHRSCQDFQSNGACSATGTNTPLSGKSAQISSRTRVQLKVDM